MGKLITIECPDFDECDENEPCKFVQMMLDVRDRTDEIMCASGIKEMINWTDPDE